MALVPGSDEYLARELQKPQKTAAQKTKDMIAISRNATAMSLPIITSANLFRAREIIGDTSAVVLSAIGAVGLLGSGLLYLKGRRSRHEQERLENLEQNMKPFKGAQTSIQAPVENTTAIDPGQEAILSTPAAIGSKSELPQQIQPQALPSEHQPSPVRAQQ